MGLFFIFFLQKLMDFIGEWVHRERERVSEWKLDWFPKRPMHAEENSKPKTRNESAQNFLQQFCFSVGMECGWDTLWLLYLQIRDYKRSGKSGSATIKAGREEMKGATNRLTAMWLMIIRLDEREKNLSTTFSATPPPPPISNSAFGATLERERDKETHTDKETETETEAWIGWVLETQLESCKRLVVIHNYCIFLWRKLSIISGIIIIPRREIGFYRP